MAYKFKDYIYIYLQMICFFLLTTTYKLKHGKMVHQMADPFEKEKTKIAFNKNRAE